MLTKNLEDRPNVDKILQIPFVSEYLYKFNKGILKSYLFHKREELDPQKILKETQTALSMSSNFSKG